MFRISRLHAFPNPCRSTAIAATSGFPLSMMQPGILLPHASEDAYVLEECTSRATLAIVGTCDASKQARSFILLLLRDVGVTLVVLQVLCLAP
jgi:hypothetical protein